MPERIKPISKDIGDEIIRPRQEGYTYLAIARKLGLGNKSTPRNHMKRVEQGTIQYRVDKRTGLTDKIIKAVEDGEMDLNKIAADLGMTSEAIYRRLYRRGIDKEIRCMYQEDSHG